MAPYRETGTYILKGGPIDEAQVLLDDHVVKVQTMSASPYAKPFADRMTKWEKKVGDMSFASIWPFPECLLAGDTGDTVYGSGFRELNLKLI